MYSNLFSKLVDVCVCVRRLSLIGGSFMYFTIGVIDRYLTLHTAFLQPMFSCDFNLVTGYIQNDLFFEFA